MKKIFLAAFILTAVSTNAQSLRCRVDSFSVKDGPTTANLTQIDDSHYVLDFRQHHFKIETDKIKGIIFFDIAEEGGMSRASGMALMPNQQGPLYLKYINRENNDVLTLKCLNY